jgi:hypothetical protein
VDNFYAKFGNSYSNPHFDNIKISLETIKRTWNLNVDYCLDLCAGGGEMTKLLGCSEGCDPYTHELYVKNTGNKCLTYSFDDIFNGKLTTKYDMIVCSYALHLADKTKLPQIIYQLSCVCNNLLIVSPNKKPIIDETWGFKATREAYINGVRVRLFKSLNTLY